MAAIILLLLLLRRSYKRPMRCERSIADWCLLWPYSRPHKAGVTSGDQSPCERWGWMILYWTPAVIIYERVIGEWIHIRTVVLYFITNVVHSTRFPTLDLYKEHHSTQNIDEPKTQRPYHLQAQYQAKSIK
jgi:hypothetical protein